LFCWNTFVLISLFAVSTVNLSKIAVGFDSKAQKESRYRRLQRFFAEGEIDMDEMACFIFSLFFISNKKKLYFNKKKLYLTIDRTNWCWGKSKINILTLAVAYEGLAIPLFWKLLNKGGNATGEEHAAIVKRFVKVFGKKRIAGVLADREFANGTFFEYLNGNQIPFYIRVKEGAQVNFFCEKPFTLQKIFAEINPKEQKWHMQPLTIYGQKLFVAVSRSESGELLIVATNQSPKNAVAIYLRRWEIENLFQSLKGRGFCFEDTHITDNKRIEKLMAVVAVAFCWAHKIGEWRAIKKPIIFKKFRDSRRPQYSYFRYGLDFLRETILHIHSKYKQFKKCLEQLLLPDDCTGISLQEVAS
jgi:hypothetical protein